MPQLSLRRDLSAVEIAMDSWTEPFWQAAAEDRLVVPQCACCNHVRWPPGPFCPECRSQETEWVAPGTGRIYSYTILPTKPAASVPGHYVPALVRFAEAGGVILLAPLVDAPLDAIRIDAEVRIDFTTAANGKAPMFRLAQ